MLIGDTILGLALAIPKVTVSPRDPDQGINKCEISHCPVPRVNLESGFKMKSVIITTQ